LSKAIAIGRWIFRFLGSYGVSVVLLLFLALLTFLGTIDQVHHGLYEVQKKYFESLIVFHRYLGVLPGVYLLLVLAFVNIFCGAILRTRLGWRHMGLFIAHAGILILLAGAFVSHEFSVRGHVTLYEGEQAESFISYDAWELVVTPQDENAGKQELAISGADLDRAASNTSVTFYADGLPFDVVVKDFAANARPVPADGVEAVDGFRLERLDHEREVERNVPGAHVVLRDTASGEEVESLLWGMARYPWAVTIDGERWAVNLRRVSWPLPFVLRLDRFTREFYPGTTTPKAFISEVTLLDDGLEQHARISMNAPLRHRGYTAYQASWGPADARPGDRLYSSLSVVRNPAEPFPLYACAAICLGLVVHFCVRLVGYLRAENARRTR